MEKRIVLACMIVLLVFIVLFAGAMIVSGCSAPTWSLPIEELK